MPPGDAAEVLMLLCHAAEGGGLLAHSGVSGVDIAVHVDLPNVNWCQERLVLPVVFSMAPRALSTAARAVLRAASGVRPSWRTSSAAVS